MVKSVSLKKVVINGLMIAFVFLATYFTHIPGPIYPGYINFGDIVIMVSAMLLGRKTGFIAGAVGSSIADITSGGLIFAPITFVVKGLEGYSAGIITEAFQKRSRKELCRITAVVVSAAVMVAGYFTAECLVLPLIDRYFGYVAAITELPLNLVQGGVSAAAAYILAAILERVGIKEALN